MVENIKRVIERQEGKAPESNSIPELVSNRDWLFEGNSYYIDTSHVMSVVQFGVDLTNPDTLKLLVEITEYGKRLGEMFQYKGEPPFENPTKTTATTCARCWVKTLTGRSRTSAPKPRATIPTKSAATPPRCWCASW